MDRYFGDCGMGAIPEKFRMQQFTPAGQVQALTEIRTRMLEEANAVGVPGGVRGGLASLFSSPIVKYGAVFAGVMLLASLGRKKRGG